MSLGLRNRRHGGEEAANLSAWVLGRVDVQVSGARGEAGEQDGFGTGGGAAVGRHEGRVVSGGRERVERLVHAAGGHAEREAGKVGVIVATPAVPVGVVTQQWMCEAVVPVVRPLNVSWTRSVCAVVSTVTAATPTPGEAMGGFSFGPDSEVV